jgi:hypothetical protein
MNYFMKLSRQMDGVSKQSCVTTGRACSLVGIRTRYLEDTFIKRYRHTGYLCLGSTCLRKRSKRAGTER